MNQKFSSEPTLLWYDYETWGVDPRRDRICQFAAIRTDLDLNPIGEPINLFCKPPADTVIDPEAVLITGLSPLEVEQNGLNEWDFAHEIYRLMSKPGTCSVGYNTIRFDDECTRYLFYRNLLDPYAREWQNGNSRWDILDVVRMYAALRPEGIKWPQHENGSPSFKLEHLTAENGLAHENAHDAVSDVQATISFARLLKEANPKLFNFAFSLRSKHEARAQLDLVNRTHHLHFTGKIAASEHCMGIEVPLFVHPDRANEVVVIDIRHNPAWLLDYSAEELQQWLYSKTDDLPEGISRPPLRTIHLNKSPMIAPFKSLTPELAENLGIDIDEITGYAATVAQNQRYVELAQEVMSQTRRYDDEEQEKDPEHLLYDGFIGNKDRALLNEMAFGKLAMENWIAEAHHFNDARLEPLVENILGRHFPNVLLPEQLEKWRNQRKKALTLPNLGQKLTVDAALDKLKTLLDKHSGHSGLLDTQTYLQQLQKNWFGSTEGKAELDEQLDLF
ncbi:exodeoxyribonuclease I [Reinekea forsetii]|nr:exodeoxyribonuclease I [Reinekea forsetii]